MLYQFTHKKVTKVINSVIDIDRVGSEAVRGMENQFLFINITNQCFEFDLQTDLLFPQQLNIDQELAILNTCFADLTLTH